MEIRLIKKTGVPHAEVEAHRQVQKEFSSAAFSDSWRGYAAFALARGGRGAGDDDFDLVLVTHTNVVVVELKNWHGKRLESDGHKWFLDGEDRGASPVEVVNLKAKKLAFIMTQKLGVERTPLRQCLRGYARQGRQDGLEGPRESVRIEHDRASQLPVRALLQAVFSGQA